jgi:c(7)-type cytochrome triheme protein
LLSAGALVLLALGAPAAAGPGPGLRLPPDHTFGEVGGSPGPVTFSHQTHVTFADGKCVACHPVPFRMLQPTTGITHEEMNAARQCGTCHDGSKASGVRDDCAHCHGARGDP